MTFPASPVPIPQRRTPSICDPADPVVDPKTKTQQSPIGTPPKIENDTHLVASSVFNHVINS